MFFLAIGSVLGIVLYIVYRWIELRAYAAAWDILSTIEAADATIDSSRGLTHKSPIDA